MAIIDWGSELGQALIEIAQAVKAEVAWRPAAMRRAWAGVLVTETRPAAPTPTLPLSASARRGAAPSSSSFAPAAPAPA